MISIDSDPKLQLHYIYLINSNTLILILVSMLNLYLSEL